MIQIGAYNQLRVARAIPHGLVLTDGRDEVLLPKKFAPEGMEEGDSFRVFVTTDSEDRPVATTQRPRGVVGEFATLKAKEITRVGTFMDWGLDKDLLIPFGEQHYPLVEGHWYVVRIFLDNRTNRVLGSTKLGKFLKGQIGSVQEGEAVDLLVVEASPEGARVIVNGESFGMIFPDELHERLRVGDKRQGFVKRVREDGALALSLQPQGYGAAVGLAPQIMERLQSEGGFLPLNDGSAPQKIREMFGVSKSTFKKALGGLLKEGKIEITHHGIRMPKG